MTHSDSEPTSPDTPIEHATLSSGRRVACLSAFHVAAIEREVGQYLRHGITVKPGDTVVDVGANIGLFSLLVHDDCQHDVTVYAFEPIPAIYRALEQNLKDADPIRLKPFPFGLSNESRTASFSFRPNMATLSTAYANDDDELQTQVVDALLRNLHATPLHLRWLRYVPKPLRVYLVKKTMRSAFQGEDVQVQLRTLSQVIREEAIDRIDLLKIDVEKSELDVMRGIDEPDWARIRQITMEAHDVDGRLETIRSLCHEHGLNTTIEQDPVLAGSNVYSLFASRSAIAP